MFLKIVLCVGVAFVLLLTGYSAGLLVQHQRDSRVAAAFDVFRALKLHKAITMGGNEHILPRAELFIDTSLQHLDDTFTFNDLPILLRESFTAFYETDWQRHALAAATGLHRLQPDLKFAISREQLQQIDAFAPHDTSEQKSLDFYANFRPDYSLYWAF